MSRQGSLRNRITELQAQLAYHDAQEPYMSSAEIKTLGTKRFTPYCVTNRCWPA